MYEIVREKYLQHMKVCVRCVTKPPDDKHTFVVTVSKLCNRALEILKEIEQCI